MCYVLCVMQDKVKKKVCRDAIKQNTRLDAGYFVYEQ